jgi:kynurenine formamidase
MDEDSGESYLSVTFKQSGEVSISADEVRVMPHGLSATHIDSIGHFRVGGRCFGMGPSEGDADDGPSIADWASKGILTRALFLDVAAVRGTAYVDPMTPVSGADLEAAVGGSGTTIEGGDALIVYMGRDAFEAQGHVVMPLSTAPPGRPGIGEDGARWLAGQPLSALCWDFVDGYAGGARTAYVHLLIWAMGLALIDNCELGGVRSAMSDRQEKTGMLVVAPLFVPGASASLVNPLLFL